MERDGADHFCPMVRHRCILFNECDGLAKHHAHTNNTAVIKVEEKQLTLGVKKSCAFCTGYDRGSVVEPDKFNLTVLVAHPNFVSHNEDLLTDDMLSDVTWMVSFVLPVSQKVTVHVGNFEVTLCAPDPL